MAAASAGPLAVDPRAPRRRARSATRRCCSPPPRRPGSRATAPPARAPPSPPARDACCSTTGSRTRRSPRICRCWSSTAPTASAMAASCRRARCASRSPPVSPAPMRWCSWARTRTGVTPRLGRQDRAARAPRAGECRGVCRPHASSPSPASAGRRNSSPRSKASALGSPRVTPSPTIIAIAPTSLQRLFSEAETAHAALVTTAKDAVRLPAEWRAHVEVLSVRAEFDDAAALDRLVDRAGQRKNAT